MIAKMKRKESRASLRASLNGENQMFINREVSKTVKDASGKDFKRKAIISIAVPEDASDIAALVNSFGSVEKLYAAAFHGVIARATYQANNLLMKGDKTTKALKKMTAGLMAVIPNLTHEAAVQMLFAGNPSVSRFFQS
jgi:hypothetical protein